MKILYLNRSSQFQMGGIFEVISQLTNPLSHLGAKIYVYKNGDCNIEEPEDLFGNGTPVFTGTLVKPGLGGWFSKHKRTKHLARLVKELKIDVVHTFGLYRAGYSAMLLKKMCGMPYVVTSHGDILPTSDRMKRKILLNRCKAILQSADYVTHLTSRMEALSHQICDTTHKSVKISNGIDISAWQNIKTSQYPYIFVLGRLVKAKGFDVVIDAFAKLVHDDFGTSLVIAGVGSYEKALFERAKNHGLPVFQLQPEELDKLPPKSVCFIGKVLGDLKKKIFCQSQLVLFPTQPHLTEESFGLVPFEAMAAKKPLIMSQLERAGQLKADGFDIEIVERPENAMDWYHKIRHALQQNAGSYLNVDNNFTLLKEYDWAHIAKRYYEVYENVLLSMR